MDKIAQRRGSAYGVHLVMVVPTEWNGGIGTELDYMKSVNTLFSDNMKIDVLDLPPGRGTVRQRLIRAAPWNLQLLGRCVLSKKMITLRTLTSEETIVYTYFVPCAVAVLTWRKLLRLHFKLVVHFSGVPFPTKDNLMSVVYSPIICALLRQVNGATVDESGSAARYVKRYCENVVKVPGVPIDANPSVTSTNWRDSVRATLGVQGKVAVAVIGPFHKWNRPSIGFVSNNLSRFDPNIVFVFVGDASPNDVASDPRMIFVGRVRDLTKFLSVLDCALVLRYKKTGAPMGKMIYAMAAGLPVITNDPEGMEVEDGETAFVAAFEDIPEVLNKLSNDPQLMKEVGSNAQELIRTQFSRHTAFQRLLGLFLGLATPKK